MHLFKHNLLLKHIKRFGKKNTTKISLALIIKMFIHKNRVKAAGSLPQQRCL